MHVPTLALNSVRSLKLFFQLQGIQILSERPVFGPFLALNNSAIFESSQLSHL